MLPRSLVKLALRATSIGYVFALIVLPLAIIVQASLASGLAGFLDDISQPQAWTAVKLTIGAALLTTIINAVFGTMTAVALVRYDFPGRWLLNSLVDLPFAIPTLVVWGRGEGDLSAVVADAIPAAQRSRFASTLGFHGSSILYDDPAAWPPVLAFLERLAR